MAGSVRKHTSFNKHTAWKENIVKNASITTVVSAANRDPVQNATQSSVSACAKHGLLPVLPYMSIGGHVDVPQAAVQAVPSSQTEQGVGCCCGRGCGSRRLIG